jgi:hypothetical protein
VRRHSTGDSPLARFTELNGMFVDLALALLRHPHPQVDRRCLGLDGPAQRALLALDPQGFDQLARAPVALFRLSLDWPPADSRGAGPNWVSLRTHDARMAFALSALMTARDMLATAPDWVRLGFGLNPHQLRWLADAPLSTLLALAVPVAEQLRLRFIRRGLFWQRVEFFAARGDRDGLHLAVASSLFLASAEQHP